jgi:RNA-directed DNA polymerase
VDWRRQARGDVIVVRYADDFIVGFQYEWEARRFWDELSERLAEYGLELHPDKTRLIEFGRFAAANRRRRGRGKPFSASHTSVGRRGRGVSRCCG